MPRQVARSLALVRADAEVGPCIYRVEDMLMVPEVLNNQAA